MAQSRMPISLLLLLALTVTLFACAAQDRDPVAAGARRRSASDLPPPPAAQVETTVHENHGDRRTDEYYWLRDREDPRVIAYLEAENAYLAGALAHTEQLQETLYEEMIGRIQETDLSVPYRRGPFWYYTRTEEGKSYPIRCRKFGSLDAPEQVLLDDNELAEGQEYFRIGVYRPSPSQGLLAFATDTTGAERFTLQFKDLETGRLLPDRIENVSYSLAWAGDGTVFYTVQDHAHRPYRVMRHRLGTDPSSDVVVHEEPDERYYCGVSKSKSEEYVFLSLGSKITSEVWFLRGDDPLGEFQVIHPREQGVEYDVEHHDERFFIVTNDDATNFKLMETPVASPGKSSWREVIAHREDAMITGLSAFADHLVIYERSGGLPQFRVRRLSDGEEHFIEFPEPAYAAGPGFNAEFDSTSFRFRYESLVTPDSVFDYDLVARTRELKKQDEVLGGYHPEDYESERLWAVARDGVKVPISIVHGKDFRRDGKGPLLLIGYGSYGANYDASFSSARLSLLDRGFAIGIAHIRGGGEMGRPWYENGKFLHKKNTFSDFIDCAEFLIENDYTSSERLAISGGSAGGLLMGAVANARPELFHAIVAHVPFVDVVTTMLDASIPLTVIEYEEWGNPNEKTFYEYMKSYSPYDNVARQDYPHMLITAGLNDPRVQYWEPAKWTARLRTRKTDDNLLLLKTNMGAGHGGRSGRYERYKEIALEYAFLLDVLGVDAPQG